MVAEFVPFQKIPRLKRGCVVTEKLDGTNACIAIQGNEITVQSRNRIITPDLDNFGFATWVAAHRDELLALGDGHHFGEWWGAGIQRRYGVVDKRFSLFNVNRWRPGRAPLPPCCSAVPILYEGDFDTAAIDRVMMDLRTEGSRAAPGFMNPEGVIVFHAASGTLFKRTFEHDEAGKESA
jgi:hypothetical protein